MDESPAARLPLVGGALALDFANTAAGRGADAPVERLRSAADLAAWAAHAGAVAPDVARRVAAASARDPAGAEALLRAALRLREAVCRIATALARDAPPPAADLALLTEFAGEAIRAARLAPAPGGGYALDFSAAPPGLALLGPVARSALELLAQADFSRLRQCPGDGCGWLFLDTTRNASRRWCDMATCGNRSKARRHRARR